MSDEPPQRSAHALAPRVSQDVDRGRRRRQPGRQPGLARARSRRRRRHDQDRPDRLRRPRHRRRQARRLSTEGNVKLVAMADAFRGSARRQPAKLAEGRRNRDRIDVPEDRQFVGFDAYQKVIDAGVDLVILATPPGFRPIHFEAAVKAGKHVFMEKPVAVDAPACAPCWPPPKTPRRRTWRSASACSATTKRVHRNDQAAARRRDRRHRLPRASTGTAPACGSTRASRRPDRNGIPDAQLVLLQLALRRPHRRAAHPQPGRDQLAQGQAIRSRPTAWAAAQVRTGKDYGEIFDHHCRRVRICRRHADVQPVPPHSRLLGQRLRARHRHQGHGRHRRRSSSDVKELATIWRVSAARSKNPYQVEHDDLFASIRAASRSTKPNTAPSSSMTSILGRMATYSGKMITWDEAINSRHQPGAEGIRLDASPPVAGRGHAGRDAGGLTSRPRIQIAGADRFATPRFRASCGFLRARSAKQISS